MVRFFRSRRAAEPDDLAQAVWLEVAAKLPDFTGDPAAFRRWIFTLAYRRLIDANRARSRRPMMWELPDSPVDDETDAVAGLEWALSLLAQLPDQQAEVVAMRILGELSVADVAEVVEKSPGAVRILTHRGLRRLEELMQFEENSDSTVTRRTVPSFTSST